MKLKLLLLLILLTSLNLLAQNRGGFSFFVAPAPALMNTTPMDDISKSQKSLSSVGGISFDQVAQPIASMKINDLNLEYNADNFDGDRLILTINGNKVYSSIYDWQLIPIAKYADSEYYACFTYFGKLTDGNLESTILNNNGNIMNYHPAFENTLLGWRLLDMDLLLIYNFTYDLPKSNNEYLIGMGEEEPDINENAKGYNNYIFYLQSVEDELNQVYRSYVLSDYKKSIHFSVQNDSLKIDEYPFYFCWRYKFDDPAFSEDTQRELIDQSYELKIEQEIAKNESFDTKMFIIDTILGKADLYSKFYNIYSSGFFIDLINMPGDRQNKVDFLDQYTTESLYQLLVDVSCDLEIYSPVYLEEFSKRMSNSELIGNANPAVWNANVNIMRYAAFFRYIKQNYPYEWGNFIGSVENVIPAPDPKTPTVIFKTGNVVIEEALQSVSNNEIASWSQIVCHPNPFTEQIVLENEIEGATVSLYGADGILHYTKENCHKNSIINTSGLNQGIYFLVVTEKDRQVKTLKLIKN